MDSEIGFSWAVDNGIRSRAASNLGESPVHDFASVVDAAIWSRTASYSYSPAHSFASVVDNALSSWRRDPLSHDFTLGLSWPDDLAIPADAREEPQAQRETEEASSALVDIHNLPPNGNGYFQGWQKGAILGFSWAVDNSIRSRAASNLGESPVHDFASVVDPGIWSRTGSYSPAHSFASVVDNALSSLRRDPLSHDFTLGLSWPDDFAIPADAWEEAQAQKARVGVASPQAGIKGVRPPLLELPPVASTWSSQPQTVTDPLSDSVSSDDDSDVADEAQNQTDEASSALVDDDSFDIHNLSPNGSGYFQSWQKGEILGKGSFGTVYEGFTRDGYFFAVKEVSLLEDGSQGKQNIFQLQQEISLLSQFRHDNIVRYLGTDKDNYKLYIFLELVTKGSLASLYQKYRLRDSQVSAYTRQILSGLKYLHDRNVVHRDIKCANILVDVNGSVKLADFGLVKATKLNDVKSSKGSPYWMAPEVVNLRNRGYGLAADIWSLGCTVLEMLTRQPPYSHLEGMQALFRIGRGQPPPVPEYLSTDARNFILKCLQVNPNKRPTAAQLLDHAFVKRPLLSSMSPVSPSINLLLS